jgi:hypothetical protein
VQTRMTYDQNMSAERLIELARLWLEDNEFPEVLSADSNRLELTMYSPTGSWRMSVLAAGDPIVTVSEQAFPIFVPQPLRAEAALLCDSLGKTVSVGDYRVDPEDGAITYKVVFPLIGGIETTQLDTLLAELVCRPLFSFGRALLPLAQFVTGAVDREACVAAICNSRKTEDAPWNLRAGSVRLN